MAGLALREKPERLRGDVLEDLPAHVREHPQAHPGRQVVVEEVEHPAQQHHRRDRRADDHDAVATLGQMLEDAFDGVPGREAGRAGRWGGVVEDALGQ